MDRTACLSCPMSLVCKSKMLLITECKRCGRRFGTIPKGSPIIGDEALVIEEVDLCPTTITVKQISTCKWCAAKAVEAQRKKEYIDWPEVRWERVEERYNKRHARDAKQDSSV